MKRTFICIYLATFTALPLGSYLYAQETNLVPPSSAAAAPTEPAVETSGLTAAEKPAPKAAVIPEKPAAGTAPKAKAVGETAPESGGAAPTMPATSPKPLAAGKPAADGTAPNAKGVGEPADDATAAGAPAAAARESWQLEISFRPNQVIQTTVFGLPSEAPAKPWHFHKLERGVGPLHLEYQELKVSLPPKVLGKPLSADATAGFIRQHLTEFLDPVTATVQPRSFDDRWRMLSPSGLGAVFTFEYPGEKDDHPERASMVVSDQLVDRWALTSIYSGIPGTEEHRVAGTRWIGISGLDRRGGFSIFTKAALRSVAEPAATVLAADAAVWTGFLNKIKTWVESLEGKAELAEVAPPMHQDWEQLRYTHFTPLEKWKDIDGVWEVRETRDTKKRFRIEIHEGMSGATLVERSPSDREIKRETRLSGAGANTWILERPQDPEVLDFLGVAAPLAMEALATNPQPSTLTITRKGEGLVAVWKGIMIQTNGQNKLDRIVTRSRTYEMVAAK